MIGFVLFFAWLGFGGDYIWALQGHHPFPWVGVILTTLAIIGVWYAYKTGPEKVLWATGARELTDPKTDAERQVANVVDEMAIAISSTTFATWRSASVFGSVSSRAPVAHSTFSGPVL